MKISIRSVVWALVLLVASGAAFAGEQAGIVWRGQTHPAFKAALEQNVPLVVYFYGEDGSGKLSWSKKLEEGALASAELSAYAGKASFVRVDTNLDDANGNVKKLVESLKITTVPTVSVLHCRTDKIEEVGQIVGYFDTATYMEKFRTLHSQAAERIAREQLVGQTTVDETALAAHLIQRLRTESTKSDVEEKKHLAQYLALQKGEAVDADQFTLTHARVQNQIDTVLGVVDEIGRLNAPEAKAAVVAFRASAARSRNVYVQSHREILELINKTGLADGASRAEAANVSTRFQKNLADSLTAMEAELRVSVPAFVQRYSVK